MSPQLVVAVISAVVALFSSTGAVVAIYRLKGQKHVDEATATEIIERTDTMHQARESKRWEDLWREWAQDRRIAAERFERLVDLEEYVTEDIHYHREVTVYHHEVNAVLEVCARVITDRDLTIPKPPAPPTLPRHRPAGPDAAQ